VLQPVRKVIEEMKLPRGEQAAYEPTELAAHLIDMSIKTIWPRTASRGRRLSAARSAAPAATARSCPWTSSAGSGPSTRGFVDALRPT
jgi:hypothetical protein